MSGTSLIGKTALITGAGSGIGKACVEEFARAGARIIAVDRDEIALAKLASGQVATVVADLAEPEKYFPDNLEPIEFYKPTTRGLESKILEKMNYLKSQDKLKK